MNIPKNMVCTITIVWREQEKAVKMGEELVAEGWKFEGKGVFSKVEERIIIRSGYDEKLAKEFSRQIEFNEIVEKEVKPKRKKRIKPAQKNKKAKK